MYLWLPVILLLVYLCRGTTTMHLPTNHEILNSKLDSSIIERNNENYRYTELNDNERSDLIEILNKENESLEKLWSIRLREKRARTDEHRRRLKAMQPKSKSKYLENLKKINLERNRRESRHNFNNNLNRNRKRRRYCSARDPGTLAFETPTVFEGKITSRSSDRRSIFSVTFEIQKIYKKQKEFNLPQSVRLQFLYRNTSECDIYRETFRPIGYVRDELEIGGVYFLFVKQINLGNFTILGQPIHKTEKVMRDVKIAVSEGYGEFSLKFLKKNLI